MRNLNSGDRLPVGRLKVVCVVLCGLLSVSLSASGAGKDDLLRSLRQRLEGVKAQVGVAVVFDGRDTLTLNNDVCYPLMSVFKFHRALAVGDACQRRGISFDSLVYIGREELRPDTYSPLRERYPAGGVSLSVAGLLEYTLHWSDNNACDILFDRFGGTGATDRYIRRLGLKQFAIQVTENEMHRDLEACYRNWSTPLEAVRLLELFLSGKAVGEPYAGFIRQTMIACQTGKDRLPAPLAGTKAVIGHKTGTGDRNADGRLIGTNDIGFVFLPDGRYYTIAVLVKDSAESAEATARVIADISEAVYRYVVQERQADA